MSRANRCSMRRASSRHSETTAMRWVIVFETRRVTNGEVTRSSRATTESPVAAIQNLDAVSNLDAVDEEKNALSHVGRVVRDPLEAVRDEDQLHVARCRRGVSLNGL